MVNNNTISQVIDKYHGEKESLLPILMDLQAKEPEHYISEELAEVVANRLDLPMSQIFEVATFFQALNLKPRGRYQIQVCDSAVCRINKSQTLVDFLENELGVKMGECTSDGYFSLDYTPCFGACDVSPAVRINKRVYGNLTVEKVRDIIMDLRSEVDHE